LFGIHQHRLPLAGVLSASLWISRRTGVFRGAGSSGASERITGCHPEPWTLSETLSGTKVKTDFVEGLGSLGIKRGGMRSRDFGNARHERGLCSQRGKSNMLSDWVADHSRIVGVVLLHLAGMNFWIGYTSLVQHPILALLNAGTAAVLTIGVVFTW